ncbi:MAG: amylo-alpha-1,6-glucosidase [Pelotomaculum sp.]|uniref:Glycogen debranching enzyme n=1 Tax=Pelotomaculum thermopropionicum (strain DSM 13744 / JCM 10971 / SI) TaxID=370438 RepID=A5D4V3_PELTS|nr:amylo-alpha-1,6-glucosidase [Pelotomaculum sp.]BAF58740.1 glycogen debranching enzyme [Pelotomaculum thermopropionicum SI]
MDICNVTGTDEFRIAPEDVRGSVEVLKEGRMFMNSLPGGEIPGGDMGGLGFYYSDTRFLSCLEMTLNGTEPVFLSRTLRDSHFAQVEMTNKEFTSRGMKVPMQTVHIRLLRMVKDGFYQRVRIINFNPSVLEINLKFKLGADFADIFEVRGTKRPSRGTRQKPVIGRQKAVLNYLGRDKVRRSTAVRFYPAPAAITEEDSYVYANYNLKLVPKKKYYVYLKVTPVVDGENTELLPVRSDLGFTRAAQYLIDSYQSWKDQCVQITTDNESFNYMLWVAITDLRALSTTYPGAGTVIEAGIPWYAAPFGRDALITAWQTLLVNPAFARETLRFLARYQGQAVDPWRDEQPGKILHELRFGEMARAGEIPHTPYYGSVDSTLWFIILLAEYVRWTGDTGFLPEMSGPLAKALEWCEKYGDIDGDGYIEYLCRSEKGLANQGWKDSWDGVVDRYGKIPSGPIALVEVQGYYYKALNEAAGIYEYTGDGTRAEELRQKAGRLKNNFLRDFWLERKGFLAYALDGQKNVVDTVVSNPGHCLFTGILPEQQGRRVVKRLMQPDLFSGWGIRTMSNEEVAYNPMSYHNGTVWPHDNAIIGYGIGMMGEVVFLKLLVETLFEAAEYFDHMRLPELFCGFTRRGKSGPVRYPIACEPQAWAAGSIFLLLRALLGIECRGAEINVRNPRLPGFLRTLRLENIRTCCGAAALEFTRRQEKTYCGVIGTEGNVKVIFG